MTQTAEVLPPEPLPPLPDPKELVFRGSDPPVAFACPKCGLLFILNKNEHPEDIEYKKKQAAAHCVKNCICGKPLDYHYYLRCKECRELLDKAKERKRFEEAQKLSIEDYPEHPVYWEGHRGDMGGEDSAYFSGIDAVLDYCENEGVDIPEYVWACSRKDLHLDAETILQDALERHSMDPENVDIPTKPHGERLQAFLDAWVKELDIHAWFQDKTRAVLLRASE